MKVPSFIIFVCALVVNGQHDPHWLSNRSVIVQLFEWKWADIARECETFLAPNGYAGVQVSSPLEHSVITNRPWWERYQPVSYIVGTRSGNEAAFTDMTRRCNAVGVRIYVDLVLNHMSATTGTGTAGSSANAGNKEYPAVPFTRPDFHATCEINWSDARSIRTCQVFRLPDLNQSRENVRQRLAEMMNRLIDLGIAGFRVNAMIHMEPSDLANIFSRLRNLNVNFGFAPNSRAFIVGEVNDNGREVISGTEYFSLGTITEFRFSDSISRTFRGQTALTWLKNFGVEWGFHPSNRVLTFVDNHDNQRVSALSYKNGRIYKMATAFHLAWNYGIPQIMSSFDFSSIDQGPPQDSSGNIVSPRFNADESCEEGWVCEHRWKEISSMVKFRNDVKGTLVTNWWDNGDNMIAFSRERRGFIAFNGQLGQTMNQRLQTSLPAGTYCDVISGGKIGNNCSGALFVVSADGFANIFISPNHAAGFIAIHVNARL